MPLLTAEFLVFTQSLLCVNALDGVADVLSGSDCYAECHQKHHSHRAVQSEDMGVDGHSAELQDQLGLRFTKKQRQLCQ